MEFITGAWESITERVFISRCEPAQVNIGLVVGDQHVLMIDTGSHPDQGRELAATAEALVGRPVDQVVITHSHSDHWFGLKGINAELSIGHESLSVLAQDSQFIGTAVQLGLSPNDLLIPTDLISLVKGLDLGGIRCEVIHFGPAHTQGDLIINLPQQNIIFVGDLLEQGSDPNFGPDSTIESWPSVLDGVLGASNEHTIFIPGHGNYLDRLFAFTQRAHIAMVYQEGKRLASNGLDQTAALAANEWPFTTETMKLALTKVYAELALQGLKADRQLRVL